MSRFTATETFTADANRTFGVEIEFKSHRHATEIATALTNAGVRTAFAGYTHATTSHWKIVTDASVRGGWELVSPPMAFNDASFAEIETVSRTLTSLGVTVDRECGLHVHHDAAGLTDNQIGKTIALYAKHESRFDGMMPVSRRGQNNRFTKSLNVKNAVEATVAAFAACRTRDDLINLMGDRYYKINVHSLSRHGTLEFRQHSGTIEARKIVSWVKITRAMLERGANAKSVAYRNDNPNVDRFFRLTCGKELAAYIRERTARLAA